MTLRRLTTINIKTTNKEGNIITKTQHVKVKVKSNEAKAFIMKQNNWTAEQYNKKYDILRNKLRSYENFLKSQGADVKKQSVSELLYKEAKAKRHYGKEYEPSIEFQRIQSFTSVSSGKAGQKALSHKKYLEKRLTMYTEGTNERFSGLIAKNAKAKEISENIKNPIMRERALVDYANQLHVEMDRRGRASKSSAIPFGETIGSTEDISFDYSAYQLND